MSHESVSVGSEEYRFEKENNWVVGGWITLQVM